MKPTSKQLISMLKKMLLIRRFEERVDDLMSQGVVHGTGHLYIGEEAVAVGACSAMEKSDYITSTHRGHGHCIAKGADVKPIMGELLGKVNGYCKGRGGSMHITDLETNNLGANGIVGGGIPIATGAGITAKMMGENRVVVCFFGDGAANQGVFHESLNLASVWKLPVIYICENNQYAQSTPIKRAFNIKHIAQRASSYGIPGKTVDGNNALAVYEAVKEAVLRARSGKGPSLIECEIYRLKGHYRGDAQKYRTREEIKVWKKKCPIRRFKEYLLKEGILDEKKFDQIDREIRLQIKEAEEFAKKSSEPSLDTLEEGVYGTHYQKRMKKRIYMPEVELTYREAVRRALREEMQKDKTVYMMGEDIGVYGGAFGVSSGLLEEFGEERIKDTPISETALVGGAVGSALTGMRPVVEIMFIDFTTLCMDQLVNQAAKIRYMYGGVAGVPMVVRTCIGSGTGSAAQHSQSLEALFVHIPGLKVVMPSTPYDTLGLLKSSIRDEDPVIFIEHGLLYNKKQFVPEQEYLVPLKKAEVKREGKDITVLATSVMVYRALSAAEKLARESISVEVVDPRTLVPLDIETIVESVIKTCHLLIVHEAPGRGGVGAEIAFQVMKSKAFDYLDAPVQRLTGKEIPMPYSPELERKAIPQEEDIISAIRKALSGYSSII